MRRSTLALILIAAAVVVISIALRAGDSAGEAAPTTSLAPDPPVPTTSIPRTTTSTTTLSSDTAVCDLYSGIITTGTVATTELVEASGLAASRTTPDILWSHNDSRGRAMLHAFTESGEDLGGYEIPDAFALDWEDMAAGPGPGGGGAYLYVGDIGDNFNIRGGLVTIYRVLDADPADLDGTFGESTPLIYRYPDASHNAEALFIDPVEPALYLVTKALDEALVFKGSLSPSDGPIDLTLVATLFLGGEVSGADMSADGTTLALRGYRSVWMWRREVGISVTEMLADTPCISPSPDEHQGEAITFDMDLAYWTVSEGAHSEIQVVERQTTND
ncbi:MAG: hypothetical protein BMS9Abin12_0245 [Acidimicrobiia bacterium]|nr:MAG: hypothetical protein BMS9Abin12_0245 [Acidimicrobiia bacterium]